MSSPEANVPEGLLAGSSPKVQASRLDFTKTNLPENQGLWAVVLDNVLTKEECADLVKAAEATTDGQWERAMVNAGGNRQVMATDIRNCGRIIWDSREVVARIWARCEPHVPEIRLLDGQPKITGNGPVMRGEVWELTRLNERMRFLKYGPNEYFRPHEDGVYETPDRKERSQFTLHLYLNDSESEPSDPLVGGATAFHSIDMKREYLVEPKVGRVLLFQHNYLLHSGADVEQGTKLTLRTDIMYKLSEEKSCKPVGEKLEKHKKNWSYRVGRYKS